VTTDTEREARTQESYPKSKPWTLRRGGGVAAVLCGTLLLTWGYLHGNIALSSSEPIVAAAMDVLLGTLLLVGLVGMCAWWWEGPKGLLGAMGFVLGFAGAALSVAHGLHAFVSASGLAEPAPWYVYERAATGIPAKVLRWVPVLPLAMTTVGIGSVRTGALGGWGSVPLVMGLFGGAYVLTDSGAVLGLGYGHVTFGVVYGLGWIVLGCLLWTERTAPKSHHD
jgi:hypothetical protein